MSELTQDLRNAGFGSALDDVEATEAAVRNLLAPGGMTPENVEAAASAAAKATGSVTNAVSTAVANPVATGTLLVVDAVNALGPVISAALTKKAAAKGSVTASDLSALITGVQALIAKL